MKKNISNERPEEFFSEYDRHLFGHGTHYNVYDKLGAHPMTAYGKKGVYFACWAPHAKSISLVGDFNSWDENASVMQKTVTDDIFEIFVPGAKIGQMYKYRVLGSDGNVTEKSDPFGFMHEVRPGKASVVCDISGFKWSDVKWMKEREATPSYAAPMAIYEVHPGSWMRHPGAPDDGFYTYEQLAERLIPYVTEMGYTHIELMGISEYPFDGSWGYQVTGYFAPTSRYGSPKDFMSFINKCHKAGIGVILDWVPAHFPKDANGLYEWDGEPLYEYADPKKKSHPDWGTHIFDYSKPEVSDFLIANALFWLREYHIDGLRVDAVASMLYLDYGKEDGQWTPNKYGGNENLEAIDFMKHFNSVIHGEFPGAITIAEESTAFPNITKWPEDGGLGFSFKWNMGWMHDFLEYMQCDPLWRKGNHNKMTFGMTYIGSENFILVLSHDEVVHLKKSMLEKIPGYDEDKFPCLKAGYAFFIAHPGKKLLFMGQDFGQRREWSEERELDWFLLDEPEHKDLQDFFKDLLHLYKNHPALYKRDYGWPAFEWINADDADRSIFSFARFAEDAKKNLLFAINFTPVEYKEYRVGVPYAGTYTLILSEDGICKKAKKFKAEKKEADGREWSVQLPMNPYGIIVLEFNEPQE